MIVRFEKGTELENYGFDLRADRVVRFDKRPTGTYMNTRATYTFNEKSYTHLFLRTRAIELQTATKKPEVEVKKTNWVKWSIIVVVIAIIASLTECNTSLNVEVNSVEVAK